MREERFATPQPIRLECAVTSADLTIATADGTESTVTLDGAQQLIDAMRVELRGDRLLVSEPRTSFLEVLTRSDRSFHVTASIPHGSAVVMKTASSDAALDGTFGEIEMKSASGDLQVTGEADGDISVKSASGDVRLPRVRGDLDVRNVSGDLVVESIDGSAAVTSVSGDVRIDSLRQGTVSVRSVSGDIVLGIEPGSAVDLDATSRSGELISDVPLADSPTADEGPTVVIRGNTASGDIRVVRAAHAHLGSGGREA